MILAMPEFDTYRGIERYAKHPNDPAARLGFLWLKHAVESKAYWDACANGYTSDLQAGAALRLGSYTTPTTEQSDSGFSFDNLLNMSEEDRAAAIGAIYEQVGIKVDP